MTAAVVPRAVTVAVDAALMLALLDASNLLFNVASLRTSAAFTALCFADAGALFVTIFPIALIVCAVPVTPRPAARVAGAAAVVCAIVTWLFAPSTLAAACGLIAASCVARALLSAPEPARFGRSAGAVFSVLFAVIAFASSHALRSETTAHGRVTGSILRAIAQRFAAPSVPEPTASARVRRQALATPPPLLLAISLDAIAPAQALAMGSTRLIARNSALFLDARRASDDGSALSARRTEFGLRDVLCEITARPPSIATFDACVRGALSDRAPLALTVRVTSADAARVDRALQGLLRVAHARTPLSQAIIAFAAQPSLDWPAPDPLLDLALAMLSAPAIRPAIVRGAVRVDELGPAIDALIERGVSATNPVVELALGRAPWFDRTVMVRTTVAATRTITVHSARYSMVLTPSQWGVALYDHELDPSLRVNRADALRSLTRSMARSIGAQIL